jgi:hypothetical protein
MYPRCSLLLTASELGQHRRKQRRRAVRWPGLSRAIQPPNPARAGGLPRLSKQPFRNTVPRPRPPKSKPARTPSKQKRTGQSEAGQPLKKPPASRSFCGGHRPRNALPLAPIDRYMTAREPKARQRVSQGHRKAGTNYRAPRFCVVGAGGGVNGGEVLAAFSAATSSDSRFMSVRSDETAS